jgi:hypothetical protein
MGPGLRELYGSTYKDLSHAAAARRAADAMTAKLPASRGPPTPPCAWVMARPEEHLIYVPEENS